MIVLQTRPFYLSSSTTNDRNYNGQTNQAFLFPIPNEMLCQMPTTPLPTFQLLLPLTLISNLSSSNCWLIPRLVQCCHVDKRLSHL